MKIGQTLMKEGLISKAELDRVLDEQSKTHDRLGEIIIRMGLLSTDELAPVLAKYFDVPFIELDRIYKDIPAEVIDLITPDLAQRFKVIPVSATDQALTVATFDPLDVQAIDSLRRKTGRKIECVIATEHDILEAVEYCYNNLRQFHKQMEGAGDIQIEEGWAAAEAITDVAEFDASDQPVVQYVKSLIIQAVNYRASDIHLSPKQHAAELRVRVDGVLHPFDPPPKGMLSAIATRIKILAGLDIAERRLPQDGRFKVKLGNREIDIRVSSFPTIYGENVVMRLLDVSQPLLGIEHLGFAPDAMRRFDRLIRQPHGLILVTGPTGSGKTTTLYSALNSIRSGERNIITIEDPVEYRLPFIQQSQVNPPIGFTFARGLRSILRQDPDVIMVGEIRDRETAEIAIHASLTGHLVFSTLHTNDAAGAAIRLVNMGIEPFLIASALLGVVGQRLIRRNCPDCREPYVPEQALLKSLNLSDIAVLHRGRGCPSCMNSGYRGRAGLYELLVVDERVRQLIMETRSSDKIRQAAVKSGMVTLDRLGVEQLREGHTTPEELLRVSRSSEENLT